MAFQTPLTPSTPLMDQPNLADLLTQRAAFEASAVQASRQPYTELIGQLEKRISQPLTDLLQRRRTRDEREGEHDFLQTERDVGLAETRAKTQLDIAQAGSAEALARSYDATTDKTGQETAQLQSLNEGFPKVAEYINKNPNTWTTLGIAQVMANLPSDSMGQYQKIEAARNLTSRDAAALSLRSFSKDMAPEDAERLWNATKPQLMQSQIVAPEFVANIGRRIQEDPTYLQSKEWLAKANTLSYHMTPLDETTVTGRYITRIGPYGEVIRQDRPALGTIGPDTATLDRTTGEIGPRTKGPSGSSGLQRASTTERKALYEMQQSLTVLDALQREMDLDISAREGESSMTVARKGWEFAGDTVGGFGFAMTDRVARRIQAIATAKQIIGKGLEGGVLRKEDEEKYNKILPTNWDDDHVAYQKLQFLREVIEANREIFLDTLEKSNIDVSQYQRKEAESPMVSVTIQDTAPDEWFEETDYERNEAGYRAYFDAVNKGQDPQNPTEVHGRIWGGHTFELPMTEMVTPERAAKFRDFYAKYPDRGRVTISGTREEQGWQSGEHDVLMPTYSMSEADRDEARDLLQTLGMPTEAQDPEAYLERRNDSTGHRRLDITGTTPEDFARKPQPLLNFDDALQLEISALIADEEEADPRYEENIMLRGSEGR